MNAQAVVDLIRTQHIKMVDARFTDLFGGWQHTIRCLRRA